MTHIATVFDCLKDMDNCLKLMVTIKELLTDFKVLWEANLKVVSGIQIHVIFSVSNTELSL